MPERRSRRRQRRLDALMDEDHGPTLVVILLLGLVLAAVLVAGVVLWRAVLWP